MLNPSVYLFNTIHAVYTTLPSSRNSHPSHLCQPQGLLPLFRFINTGLSPFEQEADTSNMSNPYRSPFDVGDDLLPPAGRGHSIKTAAGERQHLQHLLENRGLLHGLPHAHPSARLAGHLSDALRRARFPSQPEMGQPSSQQQQTKRGASAPSSHTKVKAIRTGGSNYLAAASQQRPLPVPGHSYTPPIEEDWVHAPRHPNAEPTPTNSRSVVQDIAAKHGVSMQDIATATLSGMIPQKRQRGSNPKACPLNRSGGVYVEDTADLADMMAQKRRWEQQTKVTMQSEEGGSSSSSSSSSKKKSVHFKDNDQGIEMVELQRINMMMKSLDIDTDADTDAELDGWETAVEDGDGDADWCVVKGDGEEVETEEEWCMVQVVEA